MATEKLNKLLADTAVNVSARVSPTMHPDSIRPLGDVLVGDVGDTGPGENGFRSARKALHNLYSSGIELDAAHQALLKPFPSGKRAPNGQPVAEMLIPEERAAELASAITARSARAGKFTQQHLDNIDACIADLDRKVSSAITNPRKDTLSEATTAGEIRSYVANLAKKDRMNFLHDRIEKGDHRLVTAILDGSSWVAGLNDEEFDIIKSLAKERFASRENEQAVALRKARKQVEDGAYAFANLVATKLPRVKEDRKEQALRQLKMGG